MKTFETPYHSDSVLHLHMVRVHFADGHSSGTLVHTAFLEKLVRQKIKDHGPDGRYQSATKVTINRTMPVKNGFKYDPRIQTIDWNWALGFVHDWKPEPLQMSLEQYLIEAQGLRDSDWLRGLCETLIEELVRVRIEFLNGRKDEEHVVDERDIWRVLHALLRANSPQEETVAAVSYSHVDTSASAVCRLQVETGEVRFEDWQEHLLWMHPRRQQQIAVHQAQEDCYECLDAEHPTCEVCGGITGMHKDYPARRVPVLARCVCTNSPTSDQAT